MYIYSYWASLKSLMIDGKVPSGEGLSFFLVASYPRGGCWEGSSFQLDSLEKADLYEVGGERKVDGIVKKMKKKT